MSVRARVLLTGAAAALMITTGCAGAPDPADPIPARPASAAPALPFGSTYSYPDGSTVMLSAVQYHPQHPAEFGPAFVLVKGTVTNGNSAPAWADNLLDATAGGQPARKSG